MNKKKTIKETTKINKNTPMCIFSSGIFTNACGSNLSSTRKCRLCFPGNMLSISLTFNSLTSSFPKKKENKIKYKRLLISLDDFPWHAKYEVKKQKQKAAP
jgi:hypothetical protein